MIQCHVYVGQCLGLNTLGSIYNKNRTVTCRQASGNLIVKVYMAWGIDQVENILLSVFSMINRADRLGFDGDSALTLQLHIIQNLGLHFSLCKKTCHLYNSVCQCGFTMINMCNNTKISNFTLVCHSRHSSSGYAILFYPIKRL